MSALRRASLGGSFGPRARSWCAGIAGAIAVTAGCAQVPGEGTRSVEGSEAPTRVAEATRVGATAIDTWYLRLEGPSAFEATRGAASAAARARASRVRVRELAALHTDLGEPVAAAGGAVIATLSRTTNALVVLAPEGAVPRLAAIAGVRRVERAPVYTRTLLSAVPVTGAPRLWARSSPLTGRGVRVGIIDSGIDYTHADFGGAGTTATYDANDPDVVEPGTFPTARVVGGWDFVGDTYGETDFNPRPDADPLDCLRGESQQVAGGHGTHVAGIAAGQGVTAAGSAYAGPYAASLDPGAFRVGPGVAPEASLYALKIFGCSGGTSMLGAALDRAADPDADGDLSDRLDVVNASLGVAYGLASAGEAEQVRALTELGTLVVVAAGNDGDATFSVGSPAVYPEALAVAASTDAALLTLTVVAPSSASASFAAAEGGFTTRLANSGAIEAPLVAAEPALGCATLTNASALAGKVALVDRGTCSFQNKIQRLVAAGAVAAVVIDNEDSALPFAMGGGDPGSVPIPGVMIRRADGATLRAALSQGLVVRLDPALPFAGGGAEQLAPFSSRGPAADGWFAKPEIAAPGAAIDSARVGSGGEPRSSQGTSMACPVVTGAAALVRQARPALDPLDVKALLVGAATPLFDGSGQPYTPSLVGAGRVEVERAVDLTVSARAASGSTVPSFGLVWASETRRETREVVVENHGAGPRTLAAAAAAIYPIAGVSVAVTPATVTLAPGATATLSLEVEIRPDELPPHAPDPVTPPTSGFGQPRHFLREASGVLRLEGDGEALTLPYSLFVRAGAERRGLAGACPTRDETGAVVLEIEGPSATSSPVTSVFALGVTSPRRASSDTDPEAAASDVLATGVATDALTVGFAEGSVHFALAVAGSWTTPALGQLGRLGVGVDTGADGTRDFVLELEPLTAEGPYADSIVAVAYDARTDEPTASRRYVNLLNAELLDSAPFGSSVLVMSAFLRDLGVTEEAPVLSWSAFARGRDTFGESDTTEEVVVDLSRPTVDATPYGLEGRPVFVGPGPVRFDAPAGALPPLLLLHHTNVAGLRHEVLEFAEGDLGLEAFAPARARAGETSTITLAIVNRGATPREEVAVELAVDGGTLVGATSPSGSCDEARCTLGDLAPGARAAIAVTAVPTAAGTLRVEARLVASGCEATPADDRAQVELAVVRVDPTGLSGGCSCRTTGERGSGTLGLIGWITAGALGARRRWRTRHERR